MTIQREVGAKGERLAVQYLREHDYQILETNWRYRKAEVDIIAKHDEILVFIEVKTRSYEFYGSPDSFIDQKKEALITDAGHAYMELIGHEWEVRFDVISVLWEKGKEPLLKHIEDAFFRGLE